MYKAAIIGGTGYGGAELCRQLLQHDQVELCRVVAVDEVGKKLGDVHLNLEGLSDLCFQEMTPEEAAAGMDVVLLGLPHKVSAAIAPKLFASGACVIDMSGDFRLRSLATYEKYYQPHPHPELLGTFVYGLPELNREQIIGAKRISAPGCFATAIALALMPLAHKGLLDDAAVHCVAATGSSGSGAYAKIGTHHPLRANNIKAYQVLAHRHAPEIEQTLHAAGAAPTCRVDFVPVSAPLARGILATCMLEVDAQLDSAAIGALFHGRYDAHPFVKVLDKRLPEVVSIAGTNYAEVGFSLAEPHGDKRTLVTFASLDNLIKGGAGQAVQCMNLALGLDEKAGILGDYGMWP